jgi:hypothetical protein
VHRIRGQTVSGRGVDGWQGPDLEAVIQIDRNAGIPRRENRRPNEPGSSGSGIVGKIRIRAKHPVADLESDAVSEVILALEIIEVDERKLRTRNERATKITDRVSGTRVLSPEPLQRSARRKKGQRPLDPETIELGRKA